MDRGVENFNADFIACQANTNVQNPTPLKMSDLLKGLWANISCGFFGSLVSEDSLLDNTDL